MGVANRLKQNDLKQNDLSDSKSKLRALPSEMWYHILSFVAGDMKPVAQSQSPHSNVLPDSFDSVVYLHSFVNLPHEQWPKSMSRMDVVATTKCNACERSHANN